MEKLHKIYLFIVIFILHHATINASVIYVTNTNDSGTGSLRDALLNHNYEDTIRFDPNLIANGSDTINVLNYSLYSDKAVTLIGLYNSTDTLYINGNHSEKLFYFWPNSSSQPKKYVILDSVVLINGLAAGNAGGAFEFQGDSLVIKNSFIRNCITTANNDGGAFRAIFSNKDRATLTLSNVTISGNQASIGGAFSMRSSGCDTTILNIHNTFLQDNKAWRLGGGFYYRASQGYHNIDINNSNILNNNSLGRGGGISVDGFAYPKVFLNVNNSTISNNTCDTYGGGIYSYIIWYPNYLNITNSTISNNHSGQVGSAIFTESDSSFSEINVVNSTIYGNSSSIDGATMHAHCYLPSTIEITSSILHDFDTIISLDSTTIISHGYNIFSDSITGFLSSDQIHVDSTQLNLGPLQNNGGNTLTMLPLAGSVALNNGNPIDLSNAQNGSIAGGIRDVGACENHYVSVEDIIEIPKISLYPNPNNGIFTIETLDTKVNHIQIFDQFGKLVYNQSIKNEVNRLNINLGSINPGVYFLKVAQNQKVYSQAFVKK